MRGKGPDLARAKHFGVVTLPTKFVLNLHHRFRDIPWNGDTMEWGGASTTPPSLWVNSP